MSTERNKLISWESALDTTMKVPGVKINRNEFLKKAFCHYGTVDDFDGKRPIDFFDEEVIDKVARDTINHQTLIVTSTSAVAGIPGGWVMLGTLPADVAQYYFHVIVLAQKLGYIYGWPDLIEDDGFLSEGTKQILTIFVGVMMGAQTANKAIAEVAKRLAVEAVKRIPKMALMKTSWYPILKQLGKWLGVQITKQSVGQGAAKFIPILGGVLSGGITLATFRPMASRLKNELRNEMHLFKSPDTHFYFDNESADGHSILSDKDFEVLKIRACTNIAKVDFDFSEEEKAFIVDLIEDSDLTEAEKGQLLEEAHQKEIVDIDYSAYSINDNQAICLLEGLISVINIDGVKNAEKIYLYKVAAALGVSKEDVAEMILTEKGV